MALRLWRINFISVIKQSYSNSPSSQYHLAWSLHFFSTSKQETTKPVADYLIDRHQFSLETASKASSAVTRLKSYEQTDSMIEYLKDFGFSKSHLEELVRRMPRILLANLDYTVKPKIQFLQNLGISRDDIVELISADPWILHRDVANQLGPSFGALKSFLGSDADVLKVLKVTGGFLKYNLGKTMVPNIQLMMNCGISQPQITRFLFNFPRLFLYKPERIKDYVKRVDELGMDRNSNMYLHAIRAMSSMSVESWESKWKLFRSLGFAEEEILSLFRRSPQVFAASERKIKEVSDLLRNAGKFDRSLLIKNPELMLFSAKQRIIPRLKVMETLGAKNLVKRKPSLRTLCKLSNSQFFSKYVQPYPEVVGELYVAGQVK